MQDPKTVVLGEASEESDAEEITLSDNERTSAKSRRPTSSTTGNSRHTRGPDEIQPTQYQASRASQEQDANNKSSAYMFGSALFASIGPSNSTLAKFASYAPYNLLQSTLSQSGGRENVLHASKLNDLPDSAGEKTDPMTPLHRTLFAKNHQLQASLIHLYKHPLQSASRSLYSINQRLVCDQKIVQEADDAMSRLKREQRNLDIKIDLIM